MRWRGRCATNSMQILFLHNNFPAQFGTLGQYLARKGWDVWFGTQRKNSQLPGISVFNYEPHRKVTEKIHPYAANFENAVLNAQAVARSAIKLKDAKKLNPDVIVAHSGWGPGLFAKDVWPESKYVGYFEWYYSANAPDVEFLSDDKRELDDQLRGHMRNAAILLDLEQSEFGLCPTEFQASQFSDESRKKLKVLHDGIDIQTYVKGDSQTYDIGGKTYAKNDEIITYVARGMEPYRGFPEFMRAIDIVLRERKECKVIVVGEDRVAYGKKLAKGDSYKKRALEELSLDLDRVHFTGLIPRNEYLKVLQVSTVHTYLTIPFVLSWSLMESMSAQCTIVASDTAPVREVINDDVEGVLTDSRNPRAIAEKIIEILSDPERRTRLGVAARKRIVEKYAADEIMAEKDRLFRSLIDQ